MNFRNRFMFPYLDSHRLPLDNFLIGGRGLCLGAEKTPSQKNACRRCRRIPSVQCTLCWAAFELGDATFID